MVRPAVALPCSEDASSAAEHTWPSRHQPPRRPSWRDDRQTRAAGTCSVVPVAQYAPADRPAARQSTTHARPWHSGVAMGWATSGGGVLDLDISPGAPDFLVKPLPLDHPQFTSIINYCRWLLRKPSSTDVLVQQQLRKAESERD